MRKQTKIAAITSAAALLAIGASMTSFANTWVGVDGTMDWTWVDSQGNPIEDEPGFHRGRSDWGTNSEYYYYADEYGKMLANQPVEYEGNLYYVDELGRRVTNTWEKIDLEDEYEMPDGELVSSVYYFFGSRGQATVATKSECDVFEVIKDNGLSDKGYFAFNTDGYMMLGKVTKGSDIYYFVQKDDAAFIELDGEVFADKYVTGQGLNGWAKMDVAFLLGDEIAYDENKGYATKEWFYFEKGKLIQPTDGKKTIGGVTYTFDTNGVLGKWGGKTDVATNSNSKKPSSYKTYVDSSYKTDSGNKWVQIGTYDWQYVINVRNFSDKSLIAKGVIFNYNYKGMDGVDPNSTNGDVFGDGKGYARMIKVGGKVFMIGPDGKMLTGVQEIDKNTLKAWQKDYDGEKYVWNGSFEYYVPEAIHNIIQKKPEAEWENYYFNFDDSKDLDGDRGEQITGRYSYTDSSENDVTRIFTTDGVVAPGYALYGDYLYEDGALVVAQDGASYETITIKDELRQYTISGSKVQKYVVDNPTTTEKDESTGKMLFKPDSKEEKLECQVLVGRDGKVKKRVSGFKVDDVKYDVDGYIVTKSVIAD